MSDSDEAPIEVKTQKTTQQPENDDEKPIDEKKLFNIA